MDNKTILNESAFPSKGKGIHEDNQGMSLRDYFAAKAMQTILEIGERKGWSWQSEEAAMHTIAPKAYSVADAMIKQREI